MKTTGILVAGLLALSLTNCASHKQDNAASDELVIIHTNDTHSHIDPLTDNNLGGVARRKVIIDSIRAVDPNVMLIDAGDAVQGTLYFNLYKGKVEQQVLNDLGYDIQLLGNHEFDNGMNSLHDQLAQAKPKLLCTNYDLSGSVLKGMSVPYVVKKYGNKKVGFFALNLNPKGMIAEGNYDGVKFLPWKESTMQAVDFLRNKNKCNYVVAVTHIGYSGSDENPELFGDRQLAAQTSGINLIIGGHSHTLLNPAVKVANAVGDSVTIVQAGKYGQYVGEIILNLKSGKISEKLIPVDSRLDSRRDTAFMARLEPYRAGIDSLYNIEVGKVTAAQPLSGKTAAMQNFTGDFILARGRELASNVDGSIGNKGSLRITWQPGVLTKGAVLEMMPFGNKIEVLEIKGSDLIDAFKVMKARGGDIVSGITNSSKIDPQKTYRIATIDYLANGGDYMEPLTRAKKIAASASLVYDDLLDYLAKHPVVNPSTEQRMK